eukprot:16148387-Heterocapsa_arctica.AAC.1
MDGWPTARVAIVGSGGTERLLPGGPFWGPPGERLLEGKAPPWDRRAHQGTQDTWSVVLAHCAWRAQSDCFHCA